MFMVTELQVRIHPDFSLLQDLSEQLGISPERNSLSFPDSLGRGSLRTYYSGDWLTLNVFRMQPATSFTFTTINFPDSGLVSFIVNLNSPNLSKIISGKEVSIANTVPKGVLYQGQGTPAQMQFGRGENYYFFNFNIRLNALLRKPSGADTDWLKENGVFLFQEFNPVLDPEIQQFETAHDSLIGAIAREASALRIVSQLLKEFSARFLCPPTVKQSEEEIQALFRIRHQLSTDFLAPIPTIADLARRAHMSESKFKRAFKALFGRPVYGYARYLRLLEARRLLTDGHHNISEVAFAVGYTNLTHFSNAFEAEFGIRPMNLLKQS